MEEGRAEDDAARAHIEEDLGLIRGANAAAHLHREALGDGLDQRAVVAGAFGGVEIDELDERESREFRDPVVEVVKSKAQFFAAFQLHDAAAHQVDGRDQHGSLTGIPSRRSSSLRVRASAMPKWKMLAASAASALPSRKT